MHMREGRTGSRVSNHPSQESIAESILWPKSVVAEVEDVVPETNQAPRMRFMNRTLLQVRTRNTVGDAVDTI